jgi:hypothetical protein
MIGIPCRYVVPCMYNKRIDIKNLYHECYRGETSRKTHTEVERPRKKNRRRDTREDQHSNVRKKKEKSSHT